MSQLDFISVAPLKFPLINKFYRQFNVRGRVKSHDLVWVIKSDNEIIAVAKLVPKSGFYILSGVYTVAGWRGKGVATKLIKSLLTEFTQPVYTFAYSKLSSWYVSLGFDFQKVPDELAPIFLAYCRQGRDICCLVANKHHASDNS